MATTKKKSEIQIPAEGEPTMEETQEMQHEQETTADLQFDPEDMEPQEQAPDETFIDAEDMEPDESTFDTEDQEPDREDNSAATILQQNVDTSMLSEEEKKTWGQLISKINFRSPSVAKASKREMREMMTEKNRIHTRSGTVTVETETKKLKQDMIALSASARNQRVLTGRIKGIRDIDTNSDVKQYMALIAFGNQTCQVLIPDFVLFNYNYESRLDPEIQKKVNNRMRSMIGSEIDFVVKHWDPKQKIAYGDRLKAMEKLGWNYYINEKNPDRVFREMIVEATIIAVRPRYIMVSALGVEARIPIEECGWEHYLDLRENYKNNQVVLAKVLEISQTEVRKASGEIYHLVGLQLSIRQTTIDPREKYWNDYNETSICMARVTAVDPNGSGVFVMLDDKIPALAAYPKFGRDPEVGEEQLVQITEKAIVPKSDGNKEYRIFCVFKNV